MKSIMSNYHSADRKIENPVKTRLFNSTGQNYSSYSLDYRRDIHAKIDKKFARILFVIAFSIDFPVWLWYYI